LNTSWLRVFVGTMSQADTPIFRSLMVTAMGIVKAKTTTITAQADHFEESRRFVVLNQHDLFSASIWACDVGVVSSGGLDARFEHAFLAPGLV